ncbi:error-prone translesion synthesis, partial [Halocaridina rubra]
MCIECHVSTRPQLLPDPLHDPISAVVFTIIQDVPVDHPSPQKLKGVLVVSSSSGDLISRSGVTGLHVLHVHDELALLNEIVSLVTSWDPDLLVGYEVQMSSWGYLLERGSALNVEIVSRLSRVPEGSSSHFEEEYDEFGADHTSQIHITGRIVLNIWRLMRAEVALQSYTLPNVAYHVLHQRIPTFSHDDLREWWLIDNTRFRTLEYYITRCDLTIDLLHRLDLIPRTAELARLFGIQFYDVLARGSQFRVESMMLRLARGSNMVAISPSIQQRGAMKAPEWIALTMEPQSRFYTDPVVVLDFQSLYPSVMIAYNYCYSTCLGRIDLMTGNEALEFGTTHLRIHPEELLKFADQISVSPCGVAFVPASVRRGIIPEMLEEILNTRIMIKRMMKEYKDDSSLQRVLHSRQLGLKLIANVTYGYTSANFSGRMPCSEIGDSVVSKGRETLERCIQLVNSHPTWRAKVVYGDTDSLFVHLPGRSKDQAFVIGNEIAES